MKLRLTRPAARQLDKVLAYIDQYNPQGARNVQPLGDTVRFQRSTG